MSESWPKVWGKNERIYSDDLSSTNLLHIVKGGTCSLHSHKTKSNVFYVISGKLKLRTDLGETILLPGQSFTIYAGTQHRFIALEDTIAIEIMAVRYDENDIDREDQGFIDETLNKE